MNIYVYIKDHRYIMERYQCVGVFGSASILRPFGR